MQPVVRYSVSGIPKREYWLVVDFYVLKVGTYIQSKKILLLKQS